MSASISEVPAAIAASTTARSRAPRPAQVRTLRVGLLGCGRVGQAVVAIAREHRARLHAAGLDLDFVAALVRDVSRPRNVDPDRRCVDDQRFFAAQPDVVIEVIGGTEPAGALVAGALSRGIPVVTANKTLMSERGTELRALARAHDVALAFDAAAVAGVPCLGALARRPFLRSPVVVTGILNGTTHYILHTLERGGSFADALAQAQRLGYAEPDSSADVSGQDAASKLAIILQLAGIADATRLDFPTLAIDVLTPADVLAARALDGALKPLALAVLDPDRAGAWVGPGFVDYAHPAARSSGVFNFLELQYDGAIPVTFSGPGAGADVTAATILDDVVELATGQFAETPAVSASIAPGKLRRAPISAWFVCVDGDLTAGALAELLALYHVPALRVARTPTGAAAITVPAEWTHVLAAAEVLRATGTRVVTLPAIGGSNGR